jgi:hypothetical protein
MRNLFENTVLKIMFLYTRDEKEPGKMAQRGFNNLDSRQYYYS